MNFGRRSLIKGLGIGATTLGAGRHGRAAAADAIPKRLIVVSGDGMTYDQCWPIGTETNFTLGPSHAPLEPWKNRMIAIDGIGMVSEEVDPGQKGNAHNQGAKHAFCAANTTSPDLPGGPSIDQAIAALINSPNPVTKFRTLDMAVSGWAGSGISGVFATAANTPVTSKWDPRENLTRVFGDFVVPGSAGPSLADIQREQQLAVLGLARDDFGRMSAKVGKDDRMRLDAHLSLLSDMQKQLKLTMGTAVGQGCTKPASPSVPGGAFTRYNDLWKPVSGSTTLLGAANYTISRDNNAKIMAAAMACDLVRVASFSTGYDYGVEQMYGYTAGMFGTGDMHDLVHKVNMPTNQTASLRGNVEARNIVVRQNQVEANLVATLAKELDAIPTPDGKTMLYHSVILWGGHIGYGSHDLAHLPWVILGEGGGYFKTGRHVKLPKYAKSDRGRPHNDLFLSIAEAMGTPMAKFGNPNLCSGPIAELKVS